MQTTLDPLTNLPDNKIKNTLDSQRKALEFYEKVNPVSGGNFGAQTPVQGAFGTYKPGQMITSDRNFNQLRAIDQSGWELLGKTLAQTVGGSIVGGLVSAVGFMGDLPNLISEGNIQNFERNAVSQLGNNIENYFRENFEVYQTERAQNGNLNPFSSKSRTRDATFWATMFPSIATTIPLMATGAGAAFAIARGLKFLNTGAKTQRLGSAIGAAVTSRHTENMMEGFETMESRIQELQNKGFDYLTAKEEAQKTASDVYKRGYVNLWLDLASWGGLLRGVNYASKNATDAVKVLDAASGNEVVKNVKKVLERNPGLSLKAGVERAGYTWKDWIGQSALEGLEEFNIELQKHLAVRNSDIMLGLKEGKVSGFLESFASGDAWNLLKTDKDTQNAVLMGFLSGAAFQGIGQGSAFIANRKNAENAASQSKILSDQIEFINTQLNTIEKAAITGDMEAASLAEENLITKLAFSGVNLSSGVHQGSLLQGDTANNIQMFEAIAQMTDEELTAIGRENPKEAREQAQRTADKIREVAEIFNKNADTYSNGVQDTILNIFLTEQEFMNKSSVERSARLGNKLNSYFAQEPIIAATKQLKPEHVAEARTRAELFALKEVLKNKQELGIKDIVSNQLNAFRFKMMKRTRDVAVKNLEEKIANLEATLPTEQSAEVREFAKNYLKKEEHNNLQLQKAYNDFMLVEGEATLADYVTDSTREEIIQALNTSSEKIKDEIAEYTLSKEAVEGSFISSGDKLYKVSRDGDAINLAEYDVEEQRVKGETQRFSRELLGDDFELLTAETIISPETREAVVKEVEESIKNNEISKAVTGLGKLYYSGRQGYAEAKDKFKENLKEKLRQNANLSNMSDIALSLMDRYVPQELRTEVLDLIEKEFESLKKSIQAERLKILSLTNAAKENIDVLEKALTTIKEQIRKSKQNIIDLGESFVASKLSEEHKALVTQRELDIVEARQRNATSKEINEIRNKYKETIQNKLAEILDKDVETQAKFNQQFNEVKQTVEDLKKTKNNYVIQIKELQRRQEEYERILRGATEVSPKVFIADKTSKLNAKIEYLKATFFNDLDYSLPKLQKQLKNSEQKLIDAISVLEKYDAEIEALGEANVVIKRARNEALEQLFSEGVTPDMLSDLTEKLVNRYKSLLAKSLAKRRSNQHTQSTKVLINKVAEYLKEQPNIVVDVNPVISEIGSNYIVQQTEKLKSLPEILKEIQNLGIEQYILENIFEAVDTVVIESFPEDSEVVYHGPKRTLEEYKTRLTGLDHRQDDKGESQLISDESQIRYTQFVNKTNISKLNGTDKQININIVTYKQLQEMGVEIPQSVIDEYTAKGGTLLYAIIKQEGKFLDMNGNQMDEFDPNVSIYTSFPSAGFSNLQFADDDAYLTRRYPELKSEEARKKQFQEDIVQQEKYHMQFVDSIMQKLNANEEVIIAATGKSVGIEIKADKRPYSEGFTPTSIQTVIGHSDFNLLLATQNGVTSETGESIFAKKGEMYAYDKITGNFFFLSKRRVNSEEVNSFLEILKAVAEQSELKSTKKGVKQFLKSVTFEDTTINILDFKNSLFGNLVDIKIGENKVIIGKDKQAFQIFKTDESGKLLNEFANPAGLEDALLELRHNTTTDKSGSEPYVSYSIKDGVVNAKEYTPSTNFSAYHNYLLENNIVGSRNAPQGKRFIGDTKLQINTYQFMNQNIRFDNPFKVEGESAPEVSSGIKAPSGGQNVVTIKSAVKNLMVNASQADYDARIVFYTTIYNEVESANNDEKTINRLFKEIIQYDTDAAGKALGDTDAKTITAKSKYIRDWMDANYAYFEESQEVSVPEGIYDIGVNIDMGPGVNIETIIDTGEVTSTLNIPEQFDTEDSPFSKPLTTKTRQMSQSEVQRISSNLTSRTGINTAIMSEARARKFLQDLYESGQIDESFEDDYIPHGMFRNGVAYVFSTARLDTPFHEVLHPIITQILTDNVELANNLVDSIKENSNYSDIYREILDKYPGSIVNGEVTTTAIAEVLTTIAGLEASKAYDSQSILGRLWEYIKEFFRDKLGVSPIAIESLSPNTTLAELGNMLGATQRKISVVPNLRTDIYKKTISKVPKVDNIKTKSGKSLSDIGIDPKTWYILTTSEQTSILECN